VARLPSRPRRPRLESSPTCVGPGGLWGPRGASGPLGAEDWGGGSGTAAEEGSREAREAGRARSAPALVGGCEQVAVGVCRACQQLCQERLARARAQEAGSCQPLARAVRRVRTPPNRAHTASSCTPTSPWGWGSPRTKEEEGVLTSRLGVGEGRGEPYTHNHYVSKAGPCSWPLRSVSSSSPGAPPGTYRSRDRAWARWREHQSLIPPLNSQAAP
jgi:hypothetical protein